MALVLRGVRVSLVAGGAAGPGRLADQTLVVGPADEVKGAQLLELVLVHGVSFEERPVTECFSAMTSLSSPRRGRHIGRVPHLRRREGP
jgi:hypothetical protein